MIVACSLRTGQSEFSAESLVGLLSFADPAKKDIPAVLRELEAIHSARNVEVAVGVERVHEALGLRFEAVSVA